MDLAEELENQGLGWGLVGHGWVHASLQTKLFFQLNQTMNCKIFGIYFYTQTPAEGKVVLILFHRMSYLCVFQVLKSESLAEFVPPVADSEQATPPIVAVQHLPDVQSVCVALHNGDVLSYSLGLCSDSSLIECVGSIDAGLMAMSWSPDEEVSLWLSLSVCVLTKRSVYDCHYQCVSWRRGQFMIVTISVCPDEEVSLWLSLSVCVLTNSSVCDC